MHRAREFFQSLLLALLSWLAAATANAAPVPSLYAAIVPGSDPQHSAQAAMREVLVRLVGSRDAGDDPALAGIVEDAKRYVQLERNTTHGATQVIFDGPRCARPWRARDAACGIRIVRSCGCCCRRWQAQPPTICARNSMPQRKCVDYPLRWSRPTAPGLPPIRVTPEPPPCLPPRIVPARALP